MGVDRIEESRVQSRIAEEQSIDMAKADEGDAMGIRVDGNGVLLGLVVRAFELLTCDLAPIDFLSWMLRYAEC